MNNRNVHIPGFREIEKVVRSFSVSGRLLFALLSFLLIGSSLSILYMLNRELQTEIPAQGGSLVEGIIGSPRFVNPLLAISEADKDLTSLVYSGLMRTTPTGELTPDLAENYEISEDGTVYTFILKEGAVFHDGKKVTARDVVFTITKATEPNLKSPKRANWDGVLVEAVDERVVRFTLKSPYAPFLQNTTLGILPEHLWRNVSADEFSFSSLNSEPVGSGPFKVFSIERTPSGIPSSYILHPFSLYVLGKPFLSRIELRFHENETALLDSLKRGETHAAGGLSSESLATLEGVAVRRAPLDRVFGVFFNQNQSEVLRDREVRYALDLSVNRERLIEEVLGGFATPLYEPVPKGLIERLKRGTGEVLGTTTDRVAEARSYLEGKGWMLDPSEQVLKKKRGKTTTRLAFSLSTANVPELREAAQSLKDTWGRMGALVEVKVFEGGDLNQNVIRPRKYDALLFGEIVGRELDLFAFWHSSQRNDPGLNIALYANSTADRLLSQMRESRDTRERLDSYAEFRAEVEKDIPAIFLYAPDFMYIFPDYIKGLALNSITTPSERFLSVAGWYTNTDHVWPFFAASPVSSPDDL